MRVRNVHQRSLAAPPSQVGTLLDSLSSRDDRLWPTGAWPPMRFDRPLEVGARGGHGPIRYYVEAYTPGQSIRFRFLAPRGFDGHHGFDFHEGDTGATVLRHTLEMSTRGRATVSWLLVYRPLHDALIEDCLTRAESALGLSSHPVPWSARVRLLRWMLGGSRSGASPSSSSHFSSS
jgi:hypothetical protein